MACYSPIHAWRSADNQIHFREIPGQDLKEQTLPCGHCVGCRLERSRQWAVRCLHETKCHKENAFVTLTYDQAHCPDQLEYDHFQKFMKRLRKQFAPQEIRFFMCGEYGSQLQRPHFHACLFGIDFHDKYWWGTTPSGADHYRSPTLEKLWTAGHCDVGQVTFASAAYTARYCLKKVTGWNARYAYGGKTPEFVHMSLKPGIGKAFYEKYEQDIYPNDYCVINERQTKPPKYYDRQLKKKDEASYQKIKTERNELAEMNYEDNTPQRLKTREIVAKARLELYKRGMEEI
uniref:Replication initiator protein n=1 Tax=Dulem virus 100 TaxID=3145577 RepID=A0AAU8BAR0_9VIRU